MGYTHYFPQSATIPQEAWDMFTDDVQKVLDTAQGMALTAFECDQPTKPAVAFPDLVRFNGLGDQGHETFYLPRELELKEWDEDGTRFHFCKTARKPYDVVVTAVLCLVAHHLPTYFELGSDGEPKEWLDGCALAASATGLALALPVHPYEEEPRK